MKFKVGDMVMLIQTNDRSARAIRVGTPGEVVSVGCRYPNLHTNKHPFHYGIWFTGQVQICCSIEPVLIKLEPPDEEVGTYTEESALA